ncbi:MAG: 3-isopropylmalate dehydratase small subunit [Saprospiraceae bacterium]|jgi:3-isopropylmalate dehydratase small subunit|nr:3-isopropylmalate dehydratase small subunit [Saprospiraceae bacterium]
MKTKYVYGDNIDTDRIIPGKYTKTLDMSTLAQHCMEDLDPSFATTIIKGDIVVAGDNFGCGSSREQAPLALLQSGVSLVIARYFARIFFRNAINVGLPVIEIPDHDIEKGDVLEIEIEKNYVKNITKEKFYTCNALSPVMIKIMKEGGMVNYLKKYGDYEDVAVK